MTTRKGTIVLMGSGELTATMVEVHKKMLARLPGSAHAVFLDTPAGFQLNVDEISRKAVEYFRVHVQKQLNVASYKSSEMTTPLEAEKAFYELRNANFVLFGPGSPTYAVDQLKKTPVPDILKKVVESGGCLVAASAAALAMGRYTLPVYEIYKVGQKVHWVDGLDILSSLGFNPVVVPHWNNAEGGTHDTRFCFMGKPRFRQLESQLPEEVTILGIDEHTACIVDFQAQHVDIQGIGNVTIRKHGYETTFGKGEPVPFQILMEHVDRSDWMSSKANGLRPVADGDERELNGLNQVAAIEASFRQGLAALDPNLTIQALLTLDSIIWNASKDFEDEQRISQAREILRDSIVLLGQALDSSQHHLRQNLSLLVKPLLQLRAAFRNEKKWSEADSIRDILRQANILVEDTEDGFRWELVEKDLPTQNQGGNDP